MLVPATYSAVVPTQRRKTSVLPANPKLVHELGALTGEGLTGIARGEGVGASVGAGIKVGTTVGTADGEANGLGNTGVTPGSGLGGATAITGPWLCGTADVIT